MTTDSLVAADSTVLDPGQLEEQESEERDKNHADGHSYRAQLLSDSEDTASEVALVMMMMQIGRIDDRIIEVEYDNRSGRDNRTPI